MNCPAATGVSVVTAQQANDMTELILGDCFEKLREIPEGSVELIMCDPPYDISKNVGGGIAKHSCNQLVSNLKEHGIADGYDIESFSEIVKYLQTNINCYFWCNKRQIYKYMQVYIGKMKCNFDILSWHKTNVQATYYKKYLSDTEYILHFFNGRSTTAPQNYADAHTYLVSPSTQRLNIKYGHPTIKPLDFTRRIIRNSSRVGGLVVDPFMGSGTTALACMAENRNFKGYEINEDFYNIALRRIDEFKMNTK